MCGRHQATLFNDPYVAEYVFYRKNQQPHPLCGGDMRFARTVFVGAGICGIAVLTPLYWLVDITGRSYAPPADYPQFFYGFLSVAMAWQIAFLIVGINPVFFRALMIPAMIEKFGWVATLTVLYARRRVTATDAQAAIPDLLLGILFVVAFAKTRIDARTPSE